MALRGDVTIVTVNIGSTVIASASEKRRSICFVEPSGQAANINVNNRPMASLTDGISVQTGGTKGPFSVNDYGDLVCGPWYAWSSAAAAQLAVLEGLEI